MSFITSVKLQRLKANNNKQPGININVSFQSETVGVLQKHSKIRLKWFRLTLLQLLLFVFALSIDQHRSDHH